MDDHLLIQGDARNLSFLPDKSVHACITSPPYYNLRHYATTEGEIGRTEHGGLIGYFQSLHNVFAEVRRVLRDDGTLVLNLGDTYFDGQVAGIPWQVAMMLRNDGWLLRSDSVWDKPNTIPDTAKKRPECYHEYVFVFTKTLKNYWDKYAVEKADRRSVRSVPVKGIRGAHFAAYPPDLITPYIRQATSEAGCCPSCLAPWTRLVERTRIPTRPGRNNKADASGKARRDTRRHITHVETTGWAPSCRCPHQAPIPAIVLDPFVGAGTTPLACKWAGRRSVGLDLSPSYLHYAAHRVATQKPPRPRRTPGEAPARPRDLPGQKKLFPTI